MSENIENNKISEIVALLIVGGVHAVADVGVEPEIKLTRWSIRECELQDGTRTCHIVGYNDYGYEGRVSSAIVALNMHARTAKTESGRVYMLEGNPGQHSDAEYVWQKWLSINSAMNDKDVTHIVLSQS